VWRTGEEPSAFFVFFKYFVVQSAEICVICGFVVVKINSLWFLRVRCVLSGESLRAFWYFSWFKIALSLWLKIRSPIFQIARKFFHQIFHRHQTDMFSLPVHHNADRLPRRLHECDGGTHCLVGQQSDGLG